MPPFSSLHASLPGIRLLGRGLRCTSLAVATGAALLLPASSGAQQAETEATCTEGEVLELRYGDHTEGCEIEISGDLDNFTFQAKAGDFVRLRVRSTTAPLDPRVQIRDPDGAVIEDMSCARPDFNLCAFETAPPTFMVVPMDALTKAGKYSIQVFDDNETQTGAYVLQLERIPPKEDPPVLQYDRELTDGIDPSTDVDFFSFRAAEGTEIRLSIATKSGKLDPSVEVRDPNGDFVFEESPLACGEPDFNLCVDSEDHTVETTGRYGVALFDDNLFQSGSYTLSLQCLFPPDGCLDPILRVKDPFAVYRLQEDDVGQVIGEETVFSIFADAGTGEGVVASASGPAATAAGIAADDEDTFWTLTSSSAGTIEGGVLLTGKLPGEATGERAGPFASLFQSPQDLEGLVFAADLRDADLGAGAAAIQSVESGGARCVRFQVTDAEGRSYETSRCAELGPDFERVAFSIDDETFDRPVGAALEVDLTRIEGLAFSFEEPEASTASDAQLQVSSVTLPEPRPGLLGGVALLSLLPLGWRRAPRPAGSGSRPRRGSPAARG